MIEQLGKLCKKPFFLFVFIFVFCSLPLFVFFHFHKKEKDLTKAFFQFQMLESKARITLPSRLQRKNFLLQMLQKDSYFIPQKLQKMLFLEKEIQFLTSLANHPAYGFDTKIQNRLAKLQKNALAFVVQNTKTFLEITETFERQVKPVEINYIDLHRLLSLIEHIPTKDGSIDPFAPQMIINHFDLIQKRGNTYEVSMELLTREYHTANRL